MGFLLGIFKRIFKLVIYVSLLLTIISFIPNIPPYTKFSSIPLSPLQDRSGVLAPNDALNNIQKLYNGKLLGPEAFQIWKNEVYTSLATGEIVKLSAGGHVTFVTKIGQPCTGLIQEHICGRPLGFEINEKGLLYVADAYYGIWKVDIKTDKKQQLASPNVPIDGRKPQFFNSLAVDKNGGVYWTDSSSDYVMKDGVYVGLSDPSGRLFYYNPAKNENSVLLDDLWFPNGVALSPDGSFVVVSETLKQRLLKYYVSGPKKGKSEVFLDGIPGTPDNIRALPDGSGLQIALYSASDENNPILTRTLAGVPIVRKILARVSRLIEIPFEYLNSQFPNPIFEEIVYKIGHISSVSNLAPDTSGLLIADWNGNIVEAYFNTDKSVTHVSDAIVYNDKLLLGAPHAQKFVAAVPIPPLLKKAYSPFIKDGASQKPVTKESKPTPTTTPKPTTTTTTTPKPTTTTTTPKPTTTTTTTPKPTTTTTPKPTTTTTTTPKPTTTTSTTPKPPTTTSTTPKPTTTTTPKPPTTTPKPQTKQPEVKPKATDKESQPKKEAASEKPKVETQKKPEKKEEKPAAEKPVKKEKDANAKKATKENKAPNHIPIVEEIVSDTAKPSKDKLKVITKSGPEEIPAPRV